MSEAPEQEDPNQRKEGAAPFGYAEYLRFQLGDPFTGEKQHLARFEADIRVTLIMADGTTERTTKRLTEEEIAALVERVLIRPAIATYFAEVDRRRVKELKAERERAIEMFARHTRGRRGAKPAPPTESDLPGEDA